MHRIPSSSSLSLSYYSSANVPPPSAPLKQSTPQPPPTSDDSPLPVDDPPDEIITRTPLTLPPPPPQRALPNTTIQSSWLVGVVSQVSSDYGYKLRTAAALICVLLVTVQNFMFGGFVVSYVLSILILDCTLILWFLWRPGTRTNEANPLGWWSMACVPLSFFHPSLPRLFETACLCLMLLNVFIRDFLFFLFCCIVSVGFVQVVSS